MVQQTRHVIPGQISMRTFAALATVFLIPFGILAYLNQFDRNSKDRVSEELVEQWLTAEKAGQDTTQYWENTRDPHHIRSLTDWEILESSGSGVEVLIHRTDRHGRPTAPEEYRVSIGADFDVTTKTSVRKISAARNKSDPLGHYARMAVEHVEDWLEEQRRGADGVKYWAQGSRPSRLYSVADWTVVNVPENRSETSVSVLVNSATKGGHPIRKTWRVHVAHDGSAYTSSYEPKITKMVDLSE